MRVRLLELRSLAAILTVLWSVGAVAVLVGYRPGGPADGLVAAAALLPPIIAAAAVIWPPLARGPRASAAMGWLGVITALLLIPSLAGVLGNLAAGGRQTLLPSPEVAYGAFLPLAATSLFAGLGLARAILGQTALRQRRLVVGAALGAVLTAVSAGSFGAAVLANERALREAPPRVGSPLGPTDPSLVPPTCDGTLEAGRSASVQISARGRVDGSDLGTVGLAGARDGVDESWEAQRRTAWGSGTTGYIRVGDDAWRREGAAWERVASTGAPFGPTLDTAVLAALQPGSRIAAEDVGVELLEGAKARHCRLAVDGPTALVAVPALRWLAGEDVLAREPTLRVWRGEIDWWVFGDSQLGMASVTVNGPPGGDWPRTGFQATLQAELTARDRGLPQRIDPPE